jgi:integrase/recombinase XerC
VLPRGVRAGGAAVSRGLRAAIERFDLHLRAERGLSPHTARAYLSDLRQFAEGIGAKQPSALRPDDVRRFLADDTRATPP